MKTTPGIIHVSANAQGPAAQSSDWRDEYAYTLGLQAYIYAYPVTYLSELRYNWVTNPKADFYAALNHFHNKRELANASSYKSGGSPNNDTLYSWGWLDVSKEPVILSHPNMGERYFVFEFADYYSDNFAYVGTRTTGSKAGNYAVLPPGWKGELPKDVTKSFESPTPYVLVFGRTLVDGPADVPNVVKLQDQYVITPLSYWGKKDARLPESHDVWKPYDRTGDPMADWKTINRAMTENPPPARDKGLLAQFASIGIGAGQGTDFSKMAEATKRGLARAAVESRKMIEQMLVTGAYRAKLVNGWLYPPKNFGRGGYSGDFVTRSALQCRGGIISNDPVEATYLTTFSDVEGKPLQGSQHYIIRFTPQTLPPVNYFWSVTIYGLDSNFIDNPIDRYAYGNRTKTLKKAADGSFALYLQSDSPGADKESNWLPTGKDKNFYLVLRTYGPKSEILEQVWSPPAVEPVN